MQKNKQTNTRNKKKKKLKKYIFSISVGGLLKVRKLRGQIFTGKGNK